LEQEAGFGITARQKLQFHATKTCRKTACTGACIPEFFTDSFNKEKLFAKHILHI
jgi:hypothetical protein